MLINRLLDQVGGRRNLLDFWKSRLNTKSSSFDLFAGARGKQEQQDVCFIFLI
jgi:hypothetical protein